ncbi:hypothetical protein [Corynebacterium kalidii]
MNNTECEMAQEQTRYELDLIKLTSQLSNADGADRDQIQERIDELKDGYLRRRQQHDAQNYTPPPERKARPPKVFRNRKAKKESKEWTELYPPILVDSKAYRDAGAVAAESNRNPYKTNDRKDDMRYQTYGTRNPRSRKKF